MQEVIQQDATLSKLFATETSNPLSQKLREDLLNQLSKLVETAMLSGKNGVTENALKKRLDKLYSSKSGTQFELLDDLLSQDNNAKTLTKAIDFVKPFFLNMVYNQINDEAYRVLELSLIHI